MRDITLLLVGVLAGGAVNVAVQLLLRRVDRQRALRVAVRAVYEELAEYGYRQINGEFDVVDASHLHAAWREHRVALADLGNAVYTAVSDAVGDAVYPEFGAQPPDSHNASLEKAMYLLEPHAKLPAALRSF